MGWTSYHAGFYTSSGSVDRKRECESLLNQEDYEILKAKVVGSTYYAALRSRKDGSVFAAVILTRVDNKSEFNFYYKIMSEFDGPRERSCPNDILDLLTPTKSRFALQWREDCRNEAKKLKPGDLPVGTRIRIMLDGRPMTLVKERPMYQFKRPWWYIPENGKYMPKTRIPEEFQII